MTENKGKDKGQELTVEDLNKQLALEQLEIARLQRITLEVEANKIEERRKHRLRSMAVDRRDIELAEQARQERISACSHRMPDGTSCFGGQKCSDGKVHVVCGACTLNATLEELPQHLRFLVQSRASAIGGVS